MPDAPAGKKGGCRKSLLLWALRLAFGFVILIMFLFALALDLNTSVEALGCSR